MAKKSEEPVVEPAPQPLKSADVGYTEKPLTPKPEAKDDANTVLVQAVASFEGVEGDKGPSSPPFPVSRQRYADLKANGLVELVKSEE